MYGVKESVKNTEIVPARHSRLSMDNLVHFFTTMHEISKYCRRVVLMYSCTIATVHLMQPYLQHGNAL